MAFPGPPQVAAAIVGGDGLTFNSTSATQAQHVLQYEIFHRFSQFTSY
jgi:hypothetical protein